MAKKAKRQTQYIHGYDEKEQKRLVAQARFLEPWVYSDVDFKKSRKVLEVGCGVGAQSKILLRRFPRLKIDGVDLSEQQLGQAGVYLRKEINQGRMRLFQGDAQDLSILDDKDYDGAFLCWFLEHVKDPVEVLKETRAHMKRGAPVFLTEVFNQSLFFEPYSGTFLKYWFVFNDFQWEIGGHPFVGASLGNALKKAGFKNIEIFVRTLHFDSREPRRRAEFIKFFGEILLSAAPALLKEKRVTKKVVSDLRKELRRISSTGDSVFYFNFIQARAEA